MDLRLLPDAHREAFREMVLYAFQPARGPDWDEFDPDDEVDPMTRYGLYDVAPETPDDDLATDDLVAVCGSYDFTTRVRDDWHVAGGVSAVASPPEHRRTGNVATMLDELLATYRAAGTAFSVLWPFEYEFYRRFGWAKANDGLRVTVPPEELAALCPEPAGEFRRLAADDWEAVATVHEAWATETLGVRRSEGFWRDRMFTGWREDPFVYGWERDGDLRGYVFYRVEDGDDFGDRTMVVSELAGVDREAMDHMLRFCRNHDSQVSAVRLRLPADDPVLDRLTDPGGQGERALVLTIGALLSVRTRTVTAALRVTGRDDDSFSAYHRVLSRARWSCQEAARVLLRLLVERFVPDGPIVVGLDDTIERRWGPTIEAPSTRGPWHLP